ncbi:MAG: hypothetical protein ABIO86_05940 [Sphingomonas sp.]
MRAFAILALTVSSLVISPAVAKDKKPVDPDKKSCRRQDTTGSILGGRLVCHTAAEWSRIDQVNGDNARQMRDMRNGGQGGVHP